MENFALSEQWPECKICTKQNLSQHNLCHLHFQGNLNESNFLDTNETCFERALLKYILNSIKSFLKGEKKHFHILKEM